MRVCVCVCVCVRARVSTLSTTARIHCPPHSPKTCLVAAQHLMSKGDRSTAEGFRPAADRAAGFKTYEIREQCIHSIVIFAARLQTISAWFWIEVLREALEAEVLPCQGWVQLLLQSRSLRVHQLRPQQEQKL